MSPSLAAELARLLVLGIRDEAARRPDWRPSQGVEAAVRALLDASTSPDS